MKNEQEKSTSDYEELVHILCQRKFKLTIEEQRHIEKAVSTTPPHYIVDIESRSKSIRYHRGTPIMSVLLREDTM